MNLQPPAARSAVSGPAAWRPVSFTVMLAEVLTAPTVDDARRAGRELADAGASRVLLFGSVAQGRAQPYSDIDLVAVFDDLDYTRRLSRQLDLQTAAQACTGHRVQIHVTDWWRNWQTRPA